MATSRCRPVSAAILRMISSSQSLPSGIQRDRITHSQTATSNGSDMRPLFSKQRISPASASTRPFQDSPVLSASGTDLCGRLKSRQQKHEVDLRRLGNKIPTPCPSPVGRGGEPQRAGVGHLPLLLRLQSPAVLSLFLLTGCAPHSTQKTHVAPISHHGNFQISLEVAPTPLKQMDKETFMVHLSDAKGKPLPGASVLAQLAMPSMDMGDNTVTLKERFPGYLYRHRSIHDEWGLDRDRVRNTRQTE